MQTQLMNPVLNRNTAATLMQPKPVVVNIAAKEPARRGVPNVFMFNDERLYTVNDVMNQVDIKARATIDKFIELKVLKPVRKPGRQPVHMQGRRLLFRQSAIDILAKYLSKHPKYSRANSIIVKPKATVPEAKQRSTIAKKAEIMAQLAEAIQKVDHLTEIVTQLSADVQKSK